MTAERNLPSYRILVVDDHRDAADTQAMNLRMAGQTVHVAYDAISALRIASEVKPEIVFLDLVMPRINGIWLARRLRALDGMQGLRIIALTAFTEQPFRDATEAAGFDGHVGKPASAADVLRALEDQPRRR